MATFIIPTLLDHDQVDDDKKNPNSVSPTHNNGKSACTLWSDFTFPSSIKLTPKVCQQIFMEFVKQLLYIKGQLPNPYNEIISKLNDENKDNDNNNKKRARLTSKDRKLKNLNEIMIKCSQSILNMFEYHYNNANIVNIPISIDILLLFGKSYLNPLETYSLRFYIINDDADDDDDDNNKIKSKNLRKIRSLIAKNLSSISSIWDDNISLTELRICLNINCNDNNNDNQYINDPNFCVKDNLHVRFPVKRKKNQSKLYLMNFWNKNVAKKCVKQITNNGTNKENDTPFYQIHEIQSLINNNNDDNQQKTWFLSNFKIKGIKL